MKKAKYAQLGTVSHATLRTDDLIPAFLDTLAGLRLSRADRKAYHEAKREWDRCKAKDDVLYRRPCRAHGPDPLKTEDECQEQLEYLLNETLFPLLDNYAPPFCYFGSHEGDGSDFGFWISWDTLQEAIREGETLEQDRNGGGRYRIENGAYTLVISDHGNASLYSRVGKGIW